MEVKNIPRNCFKGHDSFNQTVIKINQMGFFGLKLFIQLNQNKSLTVLVSD